MFMSDLRSNISLGTGLLCKGKNYLNLEVGMGFVYSAVLEAHATRCRYGKT